MVRKDKETVLQQFRDELVKQDLLHEGDSIGVDDETLLRFLRARGFNLKQAITMWKNCQQWRETVEGVGIDELYRQTDPYDYPEREHVFQCWPLYFHKTDKKGRPLNFHYFGGINMPKLHEKVTRERFWQTVIVNAESLTREVLPAASQAAGKHIDGTFVIVDLKGFGIGQFWQMKDFARSSFQISQDYFPETMSQLAIINAPASFTTIWSFIKPWLAKATVEKVDILGSDYQGVLLDLIDAENLPERLGGTCRCEELGGCMQGNVGPWMDGRAVRREKWLRGERDTIAVTPADRTAKPAEQDTESPQTESSETSTLSVPPALDDVEQKLRNISVEEEPVDLSLPKSQEESIQEICENHPNTRVAQSGDLHTDMAVAAA